MAGPVTMPRWQCSHFSALGVDDLYALLLARSEVFVMEQNCPFIDADGYDQGAWHLLGWDERGDDGGDESARKLAAYCRILAPGIKYAEASIGRVLTTSAYRGTGLGRELMAEALARTAALHPRMPIRIAAQQRLEKFYEEFGFRTVSAPYDEDGIVHVEMLLPA